MPMDRVPLSLVPYNFFFIFQLKLYPLPKRDFTLNPYVHYSSYAEKLWPVFQEPSNQIYQSGPRFLFCSLLLLPVIMVVISAALLSKSKTLLARQFIEITRLRIEGLLSAFLRLIESGNKDHTYIETDSIRYVYLPIESLYLVLVTNKHSNILEDLETLKLMQQIVQQCCESSVNEESVLTKAFDIVFAFDEAISFGYRESVTLAQIKAYTEMESHDEKLSLLVLQEKMKEERKRGQQIATRLDKERKEQQKLESALATERAARQAATFAAASVVTPANQSGTVSTDATPFSTTTGPTDGMFSTNVGPSKGMKLGKPKLAAAELFGALRQNPTVS